MYQVEGSARPFGELESAGEHRLVGLESGNAGDDLAKGIGHRWSALDSLGVERVGGVRMVSGKGTGDQHSGMPASVRASSGTRREARGCPPDVPSLHFTAATGAYACRPASSSRVRHPSESGLFDS